MDVEFIIGEEEMKIRAHSVFIAARSPFLRRLVLDAIERRSHTATQVNLAFLWLEAAHEREILAQSVKFAVGM